jgi:hypothetical protein
MNERRRSGCNRKVFVLKIEDLGENSSVEVAWIGHESWGIEDFFVEGFRQGGDS